MKIYDKTKNYELKVIDTFIDNETHYYVINDGETQYKVKLFDFQNKLKQPASIICKVTAFEADGSPVFEQDKYPLLSTLYTIGSTYPFKVGSRNELENGHKDFYILTDNYGFTFKLPVWKREFLHEHQQVYCRVTDISISGTLKLQPEADCLFLKSNFISYNQLLQTLDINKEDEVISLETLKAERKNNTKINNLFQQYERANGLWLISYISLILSQKKKAVNEENFLLADKLNSLYRRIAEWIIEDSDFLTVYSPDMIFSLRSKIEEELEIAKIQLYTSDLIRSGQAEKYFLKIISKIKTSGYMCNQNTRTKTILYLLLFCPSLLNSRPGDFLFFAHYLFKSGNEGNIQAVQGVINKYITMKSGELNTFTPLENTGCKMFDQRWTIIRYIAASLLLNRKERDIRTMRSMLYRYLCILDVPENRSVFIRKCFNALFTTGGYSFEFCWDDILYFNSSIFIAKVRSFINAEEIYYNGEQLFTTSFGYIKAYQKKLSIYPRNESSASISEIISLYNDRINICGSKKEKKNWKETSDLGKLRSQWDNLQSLFKYTSTSPISQQEELPAGKSLLVRVQGFNKLYPLMIFAEIDDDNYKGTGVLHVSNLARYYIPSLEDVFSLNDKFRVTVVSAEDGKIQFGLLNELDQIAASNLSPGDHISAKLVRVNKNNLTWVNENGYILYTDRSDDYQFCLGMSASLLVDGIMADNRVLATFIEETTTEIDELEAFKSLIEEYISYSQVDELDNETEEDNNTIAEETENEMAFSFPLINTEFLKELIHLHYLLISCQTDPIQRYQHIGTARLLSFIIGYKNYTEFFQQHMDYEESLYHFLYDQTIVSTPLKFKITNEEQVNHFPIIKQWQQITQILNSWNDPEAEEILYSHIKGTSLLVSNLARLVLSNNLLFHATVNKTMLLSLKTEITRILNLEINNNTTSPIEQEVAQLINLGLEDGEREFKTSLVYLAGSINQADMGLQTKVMLKAIAGFLNANGGTLYIGVRDTGDVIGLQHDFDYMKCGADGYERLLRSRIVHAFGKDINGLISFKFVTYDNRMICEIHVPRYSKFVPLDGAIWQRQGNEVRILEGMSLLLQEERRQQEKEAQKTSQKETLLSAAIKAGIEKKHTQNTKHKSAGKTIPTSLLRANPFDNEDIFASNDTVAYWSIMDSGEYIITDELPRMSGILCTLAIQDDEQNGYLLLGYENGFMNKVSVKTILSKKRKYAYKNGKVKDLQPMFISIAMNEDALFIRTVKNETEFYKLYPVNLLKTSTDLSHKGSPLFSFNFGSLLQWDVVPATLAERLDRFKNTLLTHQGVSTKSIGFDKEMNIIAEHFLR